MLLEPVGQAVHHGDGPPDADVARSLAVHLAICMATAQHIDVSPPCLFKKHLRVVHGWRVDTDKDVPCSFLGSYVRQEGSHQSCP